MTKNVFITGGLGQDAQILINILKKKKINLTILSRTKKSKTLGNVKFIKENLLNKKRLDLIFIKKKPDIVLHLASNNPSFNETNYKIFFKENFLATKNIFNSTFQSNQNAKFIFCSSSQIFKKKSGVVTEKSQNIITTDYTNFRIKSDNMMLKYKKKKKINYTNAILFNHDSKFRNKKFLLPRIIISIIKKDIVFLKNIMKLNIFSDFSHAEDICNGLYKLMFSNINKDKLIFSFGKTTSINKIIEYVIKKNKLKIDIIFNEKKIKKGLIGNNYLAKKELKWNHAKNVYIAATEIYKHYLRKGTL
ncbi:NAD-dependent epimerase/dehydratase family protein [Candidatus Pelagibacter sp.]|nr:NAD-dependent epimerase/dehydratase family protein [Candidatus Pelagibacter sp.]